MYSESVPKISDLPGDDTPTGFSSIRDEPRRLPREVILLGGIAMILAAILRFIRIGYREVFGEEWFTLAYMTEHRPNLLNAIFTGHFSLYFEFIRAWGKFVAMGNEMMLRVPSAVFGLLTCVAFFFFAQRFLRGTAFAICLLGFALNPILVFTSNEASPFAALSLFVVLSNYFIIRALDEGGRRNWTLYGLFTALGALTHPLFWFLMLAHFLFGTMRPKRTPRPFVLASVAGIFLAIVAMIAATVYAEQAFPKQLDVQRPSLGDLTRGLVAVSLGNFPRYGYGEKELVRVIMYLFLIAALALSFLYYRIRVMEASLVPDNILWIDETQDVRGKWTRLSLASFLLFQWVTFLVPAFAIMMLGSFAPAVRLRPEFFIICLPSLVLLIACGIDAIPNKIATIVMGVVFVAIMAVYDARALSDSGMGVRQAFAHIKSQNFDPRKDALLYITTPSEIKPAIERYSYPFQGISFPSKEIEKATHDRIAQAVAGKQRAFVLYYKDLRRVGRTLRSPAREWFGTRPQWSFDKSVDEKWLTSNLDGVMDDTELRMYTLKHPAPGPANP